MAGSQTLDSMLMCTQAGSNGQQQAEKKTKPADEQALKCPRCDSPNTKFCYYNNYSLTQPRYFCKSCRRYWTKGGTLRNVPVGGGCRKNNKRSSSSSSSTFPKRSSPPGPTPSDYHLIPTHPTSNIIPLYDGNSHFDIFGTGGTSFLDTLRGGGGGGGGALVESNHQHHHLLYYGGGGGGGVNVGPHHDDLMSSSIMYYDDNHHNQHQNNINISTPRMKQEAGENRMLWGFPWQLNAEGIQGNNHNYIHNNNGGNHHEIIDSRAFVGSSWNNLLNTPLM